MQQPWLPEEVVSPERAVALIEAAFPEEAPVQLELLGEGWDNTAYLVNGAWVFRFPRRTVAVELLHSECALLPELSQALPLAIPCPTHVAEPSAAFRWPFAGYRLLPGRTACVANLTLEQRAASAGSLGRFLRALHDVPADHARELGAPPDTIARLDFEARWAATQERLAHAVARGWIEEVGDWEPLRAQLPTDWAPGAGTLVHGDLYARHLLVDDAGRPAGVIDWGDVHCGDPAVDLALAHTFLPPDARDTFREAYGPVTPGTWAAARLRGLVSAAAVLVFAGDRGDVDLLREARSALDFLTCGSS